MATLKPISCNAETAEAYLRGRLSALDAQGYEQHLDECQACRELLDTAAADKEFWRRAAEGLETRADVEWPAGTCGALSSAHGSSGELAAADHRFLAQWLDPPRQAGELGSLGKYHILEVIGEGGMGIVLKAYDPDLQRLVAIKTLRPHLMRSAAARRRFTREARAAAGLRHENLLPIYAVDAWQEVPFLVMPLVSGGTLQNLGGRSRFSIEEILEVGRQIASGLAAAHAHGVVHRDIKPSNIMLMNGVRHVVIADFGLARAADDESLTRTGMIAGTPQFMSPEQARGKAVDRRSDLFSLGSLLYWMAVTRSPFAADNSFAVLSRIVDDTPIPTTSLREDLPKWLDTLLDLALRKAPEDRLQSADDLVSLMNDALNHAREPQTYALPIALRTNHRIAHIRRVITDASVMIGAVVLCVTLAVSVLLGTWHWNSRVQPDLESSSTITTQAQAETGSSQSTTAESAGTLSATTDRTPDGAAAEPVLNASVQNSPSETPVQDSTAKKPIVARTMLGPLDDLDELSAREELKNPETARYWLERLSQLSAAQVPGSLFPLIKQYADSADLALQCPARRILDKDPFQTDPDPSPFQVQD